MTNVKYKRPDIEQLSRWRDLAYDANVLAVKNALDCEYPGISDFAVLMSPAASTLIEHIAAHAQALTRRYFGRTIQLYAPLYISDYCTSGCVYCGFAANRSRPRRKLSKDEMIEEMDILKQMGIEEILILTGERTPESNFEYLKDAVTIASSRFHMVTLETFSMSLDEYRILSKIGCSGITIYQETYDQCIYKRMHKNGVKKDYYNRLDTPARALAGGIRFAGMGVLLGLAEPITDALCLFHHLSYLRKTFWQSGFSVSFPRICPQRGGFTPPFPVENKLLAQIIFAFRVCFPDMHLVLSTRENECFRDGIAGIGISKMSVASKTTVGGYHMEISQENGQFATNDTRDAISFCHILRKKGLEPVFKNWDAVYRSN